MKQVLILVGVLLFAATVSACANIGASRPDTAGGPIDRDATAETKALYANLKRITPNAVLFGHEDALAYGVGWSGEEGRSDVKDVTGSHPAVYGWELGDLENGVDSSLDDVAFADIQRWIREGYQRGGVVTISWHMDNPVSGGSSWDTTRAVAAILPGGPQHEKFKGWLDRFAAFNEGLEVDGKMVPILFRPYHENTGSWFWWGGRLASLEDYKTLWRFTVDYLRDEKGLHNLLYVYSTDVHNSEEEYLARYPGDEYVDVLGFDDYQSLRRDETVPLLTERMVRVVKLAQERGKLAAYTETGGGGQDPDYWTTRLLAALNGDPLARHITWVLPWRNANQRQNFVPYLGHPAASDFKQFTDDPLILLEDELPDLYR